MDLYIIDGNSYVYRAYYAIRSLTNSKGFPTNAIFGFTNMLMKIIRDRHPEALVVSFDSPEPTERHMLFGQYKANRKETPADLAEQLPHIRRVIEALHIRIFELPGYEADDLIGTIAKKAASGGTNVYIVTADKDMMQLVDDRIKVYDPMKDRILDREYVIGKFGVGPERVTEFMALTGDAVDNIPGVKGIGEKTAKELLSDFSSIDELLEHPERISRERLRTLIVQNRDMVLMSQKLATIDVAAPVDVDPAEFVMKEPDWLSLLSLFKEYEFSSLMKLIPQTDASAGIPARQHETVMSEERLRAIAASVSDSFAFDTEATGRNPLRDSLVGISFCNDKNSACYLPLCHVPSLVSGQVQLDTETVFSILSPLFRDEGVNKIGHNLKYDIMMLARVGVNVAGPLFDTMIAAYLLNPNKSGHGLDEVAFEYLSKRKRSFMEVLKKRKTFADVPLDEATAYAAEDAALAFELKDDLFAKLRENGLDGIYFDIEMPLIAVLADMETAGVRIEVPLLEEMSKELAAEISAIEQRIYFLAGEEFNINSPKQLSSILFTKLGLSPKKKTKTGFSTGMDVLEDLVEFHDLPQEVLHYRSLTKLKTTYIDVLPGLVNPATGRVHTSFNQTVTATGRLSSSDPNLQNIPIKGEWGKRIRSAFVAEEGNLLLSADYSQVELRILAHLSGDEGLITAFNENLDIHARTAGELFGVPLDRVTSDMRRTAKTVNFGVIYGISSFGLSETLNIDRKEAEHYIRQYFDRHPGVKRYVEELIAEAARRGFVTTLFGRKRPVPELNNKSRTVRQLGERLAVNSPIQGTAADIIKIAMINIRKRLHAASLAARMILQVHDELLFEFPEAELEAVYHEVKDEMEGVLKLSVPLKVDIGHGRNWAEAH
ncbi:MAG TPA: DNA polymerase I [Thermodesulfovibrionales bacterium]|nr:DNA polymerase I [Thermodesulfovibrionales bacterium]